jgi:hypothetical protein
MAHFGRYDDEQIRDGESSRYGRDDGRGRGSGMFGGGHRDRGGDDWHRELGRDQGWGDGERERDHYEGRFEDGPSTRSYDPSQHEGRRGRSGRDGGGRQLERRFGYDDDHEGLPVDETSRLIASNKVEGTAVYGRDGRRLGSIYNFMVDKRAGKVEYAVMSYGGFLGMCMRYYPMPWDILGYDTRLGGYRVEMVERDLERAPSFDRNSEPAFDERYGARVRNWYGLGT